MGRGVGSKQGARRTIAALDRFCERSTPGRSPDEQAVELIEFHRLGDLVKLEFSKMAAAFARRAAYEPWYSTTSAEDQPQRHQ